MLYVSMGKREVLLGWKVFTYLRNKLSETTAQLDPFRLFLGSLLGRMLE